MELLTNICKDLNITMHGFNDSDKFLRRIGLKYQAGEAYAMDIDNKKHIFYDGTRDTWERNAMIAHELGHILQGHLDGVCLDTETKETEARSFAGSLLALMVFEQYKHGVLDIKVGKEI